MARPYVILSAAVSIDGFLDDTSPERLLLSNDADFDRVDSVRAGVDAIMIGAQTMRVDNPRLLVKSEDRRRERVAAGKPEYPLKVTVSASGNLSRDLRFWHYGGEKVAYTTDEAHDKLSNELTGLADVVSLGPVVDFGAMLDDLGSRGVERIMVEGGGHIHTALLAGDLADELHLAVAPIIVGESTAPRFLLAGDYRSGRMALDHAETIGDVVVMTYRPRQGHDDAAA